MNSLYLLVNFFTILVPFIFSFHPRLKFYRHFTAFFIANLLAATAFIAWDIVFTRIGVWGFNTNYVSGIYVFNLPIEEILFFICIPFSCLFTYYCLNLFFQFRWTARKEKLFVLIASLALLIFGVSFHNKLYTFYTAVTLSILLFSFKFIFKINWLAKLVLIYPVLLIPFIVVNGLLTGSFLEAPVVWYNDAENMGIRFFTIPIEDFFYGFELILLNVFFYEHFKMKFSKYSPEKQKAVVDLSLPNPR